jgi:membrane-associated phospholipid phosphatase
VLSITIDNDVFCFRVFYRFLQNTVFFLGMPRGSCIYWADLPTLMTRLDAAARWITVILNPAVVAVLAFLFLSGLQTEGSWRWIVWAVILGPGIPSLYAVTIYMVGKASSVFLPDARQRVVPLLLAAVSCCFGAWQLTRLESPPYAVHLMSAYGLMALVSGIVSRRWGISLHAAGVCGPWVVGLVTVGSGYVWALPLPVAIGWARVRSRGHTLVQVLVGAILGCASALVTWWLVSKLGIDH